MTIVSQDKTEIVNFENILSIKLYYDEEDPKCLFELYSCVNAPGDNYILMGIYKTKERAKEVLQGIITAYSNFEYLKYCDTEIKKEIAEQILSTQYNYFDVYEMPLE